MAERVENLLHMSGVVKTFGPVRALDGVDLQVAPGEVHALIGENGAGKSTLMKVLSGAHAATAGDIMFMGKSYTPKSPAHARESGIAMIYQELTLCPDLSVEENITLGAEDSCFDVIRKQPQKIREALTLLGYPDLPLRQKVGDFSLGVQQVIEIARALVLKAKLIILDEPTSSLSGKDTQMLFGVVRKLKEQGIAIIYISHFLEEIKELCDRFTVLRDGATVGKGVVAETSTDRIIELMVGRSVDDLYPRIPHSIGDEILSVENLAGRTLPAGIGFKLRRGEILGIAGIVGAGRSETVRALFGIAPARDGTLHIEGKSGVFKAAVLNPQRMLHSGVDLLSENRKEEGLAVDRSLWDNVTLSSVHRRSWFGWTSPASEMTESKRWLAKLRVKHHSPDQPASDLSGGNQQKVAIARILLHGADILMLDEPTRGIDVGSKQEIYRLIGELASEGKALIVVSSYLPELFGLCDTMAVMYRGSLSQIRPVDEWSENEVMQFATSGQQTAQDAKENNHV